MRLIFISIVYIFSIVSFLIFTIGYNFDIYEINELLHESVVEWLQVFFLLASSSLLLISYYRTKRIFLLCCAILFVFILMEEISWGQIIFNFETPDFFQKYNIQNETNLHNVLDFLTTCPYKDNKLCSNSPFHLFWHLMVQIALIPIVISVLTASVLSNFNKFKKYTVFRKIDDHLKNRRFLILGLVMYLPSIDWPFEIIPINDEIFEFFGALSFLFFASLTFIDYGFDKKLLGKINRLFHS